MLVRLCNGSSGETLQEFLVKHTIESARVGKHGIIFHLDIETILLRFSELETAKKFFTMVSSIRLAYWLYILNELFILLHKYAKGAIQATDLQVLHFFLRSGNQVSVFRDRTEESSAAQYFQFYGYLSQQQNMMQDFVRTSTYQKAILSNLTDFRNKVVLDVGAGSGILSFIAQQAGAAKVGIANWSDVIQLSHGLFSMAPYNKKMQTHVNKRLNFTGLCSGSFKYSQTRRRIGASKQGRSCNQSSFRQNRRN